MKVLMTILTLGLVTLCCTRTTATGSIIPEKDERKIIADGTRLKDIGHSDESRTVENETSNTLSRWKRATGTAVEFTQADEDEILLRHNELRSEKGASNMEYMIPRQTAESGDIETVGVVAKTVLVTSVPFPNFPLEDSCPAFVTHLKWNSELARMAQDYTLQCVFVHSDMQRGDYNLSEAYVGENLHYTTSKITLTKVVDDWYSEVVDFVYDTVKCTGPECGHYTQVVWATSNKIGCAKSLCNPLDVNGAMKTNAYLVSCNYIVRGNYKGAKPYKIGDPCTECRDIDLYNDKLCDMNMCSDTGGETTAGGDDDSGARARGPDLTVLMTTCWIYYHIQGTFF